MTTFNKAWQFIHDHPEIHQTGSRYWNAIDPEKVPITKDTDYDFVAQFSCEIMNELEKHGFTTRNEGFKQAIDKMEISEVNNYEREGTVIVYYFESVQVILKNNLSIYLQVQNTVGVDFYVNYLWKKNRTPKQIQDTLNFLYGINK